MRLDLLSSSMPTSSSSSYFWHFSFSNAMVILFHINNNYTAQNWYETGKQEPLSDAQRYIFLTYLSLTKSLYYLSGIFVLFHFAFLHSSSTSTSSSFPSKRLTSLFLFYFCVCLFLRKENKNQNAINTEIDKDIWGGRRICLEDTNG